MPIYEYRCNECGHELETLQKISDPPLVECPACHRPALQKLVSAAAFHLKGTGWYVTDFKDKGKKPAGKAENQAGSGDAAAKPAAGSASGGSGGAEKTPGGGGGTTSSSEGKKTSD